MGYGYGMMGFGWLWSIVLTSAFIGIIVFAAVRLANGSIHRHNRHNRDNRDNRDSNQALDILNQKFAMGEISEEEYKRKKELLRQ